MLKQLMWKIDGGFAALADPLLLLARLVVFPMYFLAGIEKVLHYSSTAGLMESSGLPAALLPLAILLEIAGSIFLVLGLLTRLTSVAFIVYSIIAIVVFLGAPVVDNYLFYAEVAVLGVFLAFIAVGPGGWSLDALIGRSNSPGSAQR